MEEDSNMMDEPKKPVPVVEGEEAPAAETPENGEGSEA